MPESETQGRPKAEATVGFDHHRPIAEKNPDEAFAELRRSCPVAWTEANGGHWVTSKYADVEKVLKDWRTFSSTSGITIPKSAATGTAMVDFDPPEHIAYRRVLNPLLGPDVVADRFGPRISYWTTLFIDRVIEKGHCDLIQEIAVQIPAAVTLEWLGWEDRSQWRSIGAAWHNIMSLADNDPRRAEAGATLQMFDAGVRAALKDRRESPRDDGLSAVANMEVGGEFVPDDAAASLVRVLMAAGSETTTSLIGSTLVHLDQHPEDRQRLMDDPSLWEPATEEFLRRYTPARNVARVCVQETTLGGQSIMPGEFVLAGVSSANLDEDLFEDPLAVDLERGPKHLSFGAGVHKCVGLYLARSEFTHVMRTVLERLPDYRINRESLVANPRQPVNAGWARAEATFTPGERLLPPQDHERHPAPTTAGH
jgi:cytochrome P450